MKVPTPRRHRLILVLLTCTCSGIRPPAVSTVAIDACKDSRTWQNDLRSVLPGTGLRINGVYIRNTCDGTTQVAGAELLLDRPESSSPTALARMLRCGASRVFFVRDERASAPPSLPWLPNGWVEISVESRERNIRVTLSADSVAKNIELLRRAATLASMRVPGSD